MPRGGETIDIGGVRAHYQAHEKAHIRALIEASDVGRCSPASAWAQITFLHALKVELEAVIVDEIEEASVRRGWDAADVALEAEIEPERQAVPA